VDIEDIGRTVDDEAGGRVRQQHLFDVLTQVQRSTLLAPRGRSPLYRRGCRLIGQRAPPWPPRRTLEYPVLAVQGHEQPAGWLRQLGAPEKQHAARLERIMENLGHA